MSCHSLVNMLVVYYLPVHFLRPPAFLQASASELSGSYTLDSHA
jgi:hypothetical protein